MNYARFSQVRFGTGLSPRFAGAASPEELMDSLQNDAMVRRFPTIGNAEAAAIATAYAQANKNETKVAGGADARKKAEAVLMNAATRATKARIARALEDETGFADRLAQFWASHFSIRAGGQNMAILTSAFHEDAIRANQRTRFADLLRAATLHPAMLLYLDQNASTGPNSPLAVTRRRKGQGSPGLNENHARELLELHSMGVGSGYTQQDVRQLAELMTGLGINAKREFDFNKNRAEPGAETVLGAEYGGGRPPRLAEFVAFLEDLSVRPETARFICTKLVRHFCTDDPPSKLLNEMIARFRDTGGELVPVYEVMVGHAQSRETFAQKVRQPQDLLIASLRALRIGGDRIMALEGKELWRLYVRPLTRMGQNPQGAPQPEGWPESAMSWLTPQLLAARINWAMGQPAKLLDQLPDPREFASQVIAGPTRDRVIDMAARAESRSDGIGIVLASPQFNRR
ncbi:DUF1800 domain-containing protein [Paracoccus aurantiacus]|uniref:DUF1800 domain-containing protein n=1 Tax=Paracoccus aurantiacus TaxID=2599412 RepID=A0A5C6S4S6_9RHOB|nr:DUF1800 domain-containing protein [Paracoccus aurantiacus]TXB69828.1 DUF1800 domain-containing protein [Paracoccus aurantiacus]